MASPGDEVSIYGTNLELADDELTSVYIQPGSGTGQWATVTSRNPYRVTFTVPSTLATGASYEVWAHNGHGQDYGWSNPIKLAVRAPLPTTTGSSAIFDVKAWGAKGDGATDDYIPIQNAIKAANDYVNQNNGVGATVYFPGGTYLTSKTLNNNENVGIHNIHYQGPSDPGLPAATLRPTGGMNGLFYMENYIPENLTFSNLIIEANSSIAKASEGGALIHVRNGQDVVFDNVTLVADQAGVNPLDLTGTDRVTIRNCDFTSSGFIDFTAAAQIEVDNCDFRGANDADSMMYFVQSRNVSVTNCTAQDFNPNMTTYRGFAVGRFLVAQGNWNENFYVANNTTIDFAPKYGVSTDPNQGEQILFEAGGPVFFGRPVAADGDEVEFDDLGSDFLSSLGRLSALVIDGKGLGQLRMVKTLDTMTNEITVDPPWTVIPDASSTIALAGVQNNVVIYGNKLDGKEEWITGAGSSAQTASGGIQIEGVAHVEIAGNTITDVRRGVYIFPNQRSVTTSANDDPRPRFDTNLFNCICDNTIKNVFDGIAVTTGNYLLENGIVSVGYGSAELGTVVRGNHLQKIHKSVLLCETDFDYRAIDLAILEDNKYTGSPIDGLVGVKLTSSSLGQNTFNVLVRGNDFADLTGTEQGIVFAAKGTPALFDNQWGQADAYAGANEPNAIIELPTRVVRVEWVSESVGAALPLRNAGTSKLSYTASSDSSWLTVLGADPKIDPESESLLYVTANLTGLGAGDFTATVTIASTDQSQRQTFTVIASVASGNFGPYAGVLPNIRHDKVTTIEAEHYDRGGNNVGFYDPQAEDHVEFIDPGFAIVQPPNGNWYEYTVNVPADGWYRVEARIRSNGSGGKLTLDYGATSVDFHAPNSADWATRQAEVDTYAAEEFIYLSYGVQTLRLNMASSNSPDLDWFRFVPVTEETYAAIPVSYHDDAPSVSLAAATYLQTEHFDKGGVGIAYSTNWTGNTLSDFRDDELVNMHNFGLATTDLAVRGAAGQWLNYSIQVAQAGSYHVQFRVANTAAGGTIRFQTPDGISLFNDTGASTVAIPNTGGFAQWEYVTRSIAFTSAGLHTVQIKFDSNATNGVAAQIDRVHIWQGSFVGPLQAPPTGSTSNAGGFKQVGTAFAVSVSGQIDKLRFYLNATEALQGGSHTLRLWKINEAEVVSENVIFSDADELASATTTATGAGWKEVAISPVNVDPGLYMVSVNVVSHYSITTINHVTPAATPSLLTIVAGSYSTNANVPFPEAVYSNASLGFPTAFFWLDVSFTPLY